MTDIASQPETQLPGFLQSGPKLLIIDGEAVPARSGATFESISPATGTVLAELAQAGREDVDLAVAAARRAFEGPWRRFTPAQRQAVLLRLADLIDENFDEIAVIDSMDMGAPISGAAFKRQRAVSLLRYAAGQVTLIHGQTVTNSQSPSIFSYTVKEPVGVVAAITAWNGGVGSGIWKLSTALAAGCTFILKPGEQAPLSAVRLGELCLEAGIPPGVVNVVNGPGTVGAALAEHPGVDKVAFTGSTAVGQAIIRASAGNVKRVSMELGGKSANIVFDDANLELAVPGAAMAVFGNSGQSCSAGSRMFVQRGIYDAFVAEVASFARGLKLGDPLDPRTQLGPLVSQEQLDRVTGFLESGKAEGARAAAGGSRARGTDLDSGYYVEPTVFADVADTMRIAREEIFGPVISAIPFGDAEEAVRRANASEYGLGGGVWTRSLSNIHTVSRGLRAGSVWVNCYQVMDPSMPFGGYKMSGFGRESGSEHIEEFLQTKSVWVETAD
jgi:aldehyde dehydrogenase (NAD+)